MRVTFTGGDQPQRWRYRPADVMISQAQAIERALGQGRTWDDFAVGIRAGDATCRKVLLWHLQALDHPGLRFEDVPDFRLGDLTIEFDSDEVEQIIENVKGAYLPEDRKRRILLDLDLELAAALEREALDEAEHDDPGKDEVPAASPNSPAT